MYRFTLCLLLACFLPGLLSANAQDRAKFIAPFVEEQTILVIRVDFTRINLAQAVEQLKPFTVGFEEDAAQARRAAELWLTAFRDVGGKEIYLCFSVADFPTQSEYFILPLEGNLDLTKLKPLLQRHGSTEAKVMHNAMVVGHEGLLARLASRKATPRPEVAQAFAAVGEGALQVLFVPPPHFKRVIEENMPNLPKELGGGSIKLLTEGVRWAALSADVSPEVRIKLTTQAQDAAAAQRLKEWLPGMFKALGEVERIKEFLPMFGQFTATLVPEIQGDRLTLNLEVPRLAKMWSEAGPHFRRQGEINRHQRNLRDFAIAMHNFHGDFDRLPGHAIYSKEGKPLLSWRVQLLPYLNQDNLYRQFKLDEPWDSEHNKKLLPLMPQIFNVPGVKAPPGHTFYQVIVTPPGYKGKHNTIFTAAPGHFLTLGRITVADGTSNTILLAEANKAVPWTKPEDVEMPDDDKPVPVFGAKPGEAMFGTVFGDGSVRMLRRSLKDEQEYQKLIRQLLGWNDGDNNDWSPLIEREPAEQSRRFR